ncbi:ThiF family adenylyltransferase [Myxococcota bacterium]|nr:ThiF family adenylyltransferase [Myxococcota bacterium]
MERMKMFLRGRTPESPRPAAIVLGPEVLRGRPGEAAFGRVIDDGDERVVVLESLAPRDGLTEQAVIASAGDPLGRGPGLVLTLEPEASAHADGVPVEVLSRAPDRYRDRVRALPAAEAVRGRRAALVGLGSVGSTIGLALARVGVRLVAFDPDRLSMENLVRWGAPASPADVGRRKVQVFQEQCRDAIPGAEVTAIPLDVVRRAPELDRALRDARPDLLICTTDTRDSRVEVNAAAVRLGIPAMFVALSDGASSVRVEVVEDARRGPCHLCAVRGEEGLELSSRPRSSRTPYGAGSNELSAVPALPVDIALASNVAARIALALLGREDWHRYFVHGEQRGSILFYSLEANWWVFETAWEKLVYAPVRLEDCPACGR